MVIVRFDIDFCRVSLPFNCTCFSFTEVYIFFLVGNNKAAATMKCVLNELMQLQSIHSRFVQNVDERFLITMRSRECFSLTRLSHYSLLSN